MVGRPYLLKLAKNQVSTFSFVLSEGTEVSLDVQYFTGLATYQVQDWSESSIYYPDPTFNDSSLLVATETKSTLNLKLKQLLNGRTYQIIVRAVGSDLHASLLLS